MPSSLANKNARLANLSDVSSDAATTSANGTQASGQFPGEEPHLSTFLQAPDEAGIPTVAADWAHPQNVVQQNNSSDQMDMFYFGQRSGDEPCQSPTPGPRPANEFMGSWRRTHSQNEARRTWCSGAHQNRVRPRANSSRSETLSAALGKRRRADSDAAMTNSRFPTMDDLSVTMPSATQQRTPVAAQVGYDQSPMQQACAQWEPSQNVPGEVGAGDFDLPMDLPAQFWGNGQPVPGWMAYPGPEIDLAGQVNGALQSQQPVMNGRYDLPEIPGWQDPGLEARNAAAANWSQRLQQARRARRFDPAVMAQLGHPPAATSNGATGNGTQHWPPPYPPRRLNTQAAQFGPYPRPAAIDGATAFPDSSQGAMLPNGDGPPFGRHGVSNLIPANGHGATGNRFQPLQRAAICARSYAPATAQMAHPTAVTSNGATAFPNGADRILQPNGDGPTPGRPLLSDLMPGAGHPATANGTQQPKQRAPRRRTDSQATPTAPQSYQQLTWAKPEYDPPPPPPPQAGPPPPSADPSKKSRNMTSTCKFLYCADPANIDKMNAQAERNREKRRRKKAEKEAEREASASAASEVASTADLQSTAGDEGAVNGNGASEGQPAVREASSAAEDASMADPGSVADDEGAVNGDDEAPGAAAAGDADAGTGTGTAGS